MARRRQPARYWRVGFAIVLTTATCAVFLVVSAVGGEWLGRWQGRLLLGATGAAAPWLLRAAVRRRVSGAGVLPLRWLLLAAQTGALVVLCLGFGDSTGRALRRRGDWFLGKRDGAAAAALRGVILVAARALERFDTPDEIALSRGAPPPPSPAPAGARASWCHPLPAVAGRRVMPGNASARFGAPRPGARPAECELGHCGVDLAGPRGVPVHAVADGVVVRVQRRDRGISGRFVIVDHRAGRVRSKYIHLHELSADLRAGGRVRAGQRIGTLGRSGIKRSRPHLHFALRVRRAGRWRYVDPEPLLWVWSLPGRRPSSTAPAVAARSTAVE